MNRKAAGDAASEGDAPSQGPAPDRSGGRNGPERGRSACGKRQECRAGRRAGEVGGAGSAALRRRRPRQLRHARAAGDRARAAQLRWRARRPKAEADAGLVAGLRRRPDRCRARAGLESAGLLPAPGSSQVADTSSRVADLGGEVDALKKSVADLKSNAPQPSPDTSKAVDALQAQVKSLSDKLAQLRSSAQSSGAVERIRPGRPQGRSGAGAGRASTICRRPSRA